MPRRTVMFIATLLLLQHVYLSQLHGKWAGTVNMINVNGGGYTQPNKLFGHIHIAKSGGTTLNAMLANRYERVCGHKGYSIDAFRENEKFKEESKKKGFVMVPTGVRLSTMDKDIGWEDCDYVSNEIGYNFWIEKFGDSRFYNLTMELHVPCRDHIDHLMSQCNYAGKQLDCNATSEEAFFQSVKNCDLEGEILLQPRFNNKLLSHFDVKCFDFKKQFTEYVDYISQYLQPRRLVSDPLIRRETNLPRNKSTECIWDNPELIKKAKRYLIDKVDLYRFCDMCMGGINDLTNPELSLQPK
mmetsp:Transcript_5627/g.10175  ORF Transcript_5627/g.10175 Transcript_5627/m.10175 type:complete len:299 (+) Transcript_5627:3-899(+)